MRKVETWEVENIDFSLDISYNMIKPMADYYLRRKKIMTKKLVAMLLTLAMALTCLSLTAFAETEPLALTVGENYVTVPAGEEDYYRIVTFTPELTGYYLINVDWEALAVCWADADMIYDGTYEYFIMEAGVTYEVSVVNLDEVEAEYTVYVEYFEDLEILVPVAMEITKLPDNTTYLKNDGYDGYDIVLDGLEMNVTWDDGSITAWSYDEDGYEVGTYSLSYSLPDVTDDPAMVTLSLDGLNVEASFEVTLLDIEPVSIELVDATPVTIIENSCGFALSVMDLDEVWYYMPIVGLDREVIITFSDGSTVNAVPGDVIYGFEVYAQDNQWETFWTGDNGCILYSYCNQETELQVLIVDSPVESVELLTPPTNNTLMQDEDYNLVNAEGEVVESVRQLLEGMSLKVNYKDGTSKTFEPDDIEWMDYEDVEIPLVDGYPVDIWDAFLGMLYGEEEPPCEIEMPLGYMGAEFSYTLSIVESFEEDSQEPPVDEEKDPDVEQIPDTGDDMLVMLVLVSTMMLGAVLVSKKKMF